MSEAIPRTPANWFRLIVITVILVGTTWSIALFVLESPAQKRNSIARFMSLHTASLESAVLSPFLPVVLNIPTIGLSSTIESVGLLPNGLMGSPADPMITAWFKEGPKPGEIGSAVIAGHYGWKDATPAAFDNLNTLRVGDEFNVLSENGTTRTFLVRKTQIFDQNADTTMVFNSGDGYAHLNLITCSGNWNPQDASYTERLVIFSDMVTP